MYVRNKTMIQATNKGGPRCVNLEADSSTIHSPEETDTIAAPGSVA